MLSNSVPDLQQYNWLGLITTMRSGNEAGWELNRNMFYRLKTLLSLCNSFMFLLYDSCLL